MNASARKNFMPLGSFTSSTPRAQLLGALKHLKPQFNMRLRVLERGPPTPRYQLEIEVRDLDRPHLIDPWLGIKGALTSAFPSHKPGAVRRLEP